MCFVHSGVSVPCLDVLIKGSSEPVELHSVLFNQESYSDIANLCYTPEILSAYSSGQAILAHTNIHEAQIKRAINTEEMAFRKMKISFS